MRIDLTAQPILEFAAESEGGEPRRMVAGVVVPYGVAANVGGKVVEFERGSVTAREHVPYLLGHDANRPVGVMVTNANGDAGLSGVFAVDSTPDGDMALTQAKSGSRRGLSAGVDVIDYRDGDDGRMIVTAGELAEVSQVTLAAFTDAAITTVAASEPKGAVMDTDPTPTPVEASEPTPDPEPAPERRPVIVTADRPAAPMRFGEYIQNYIRAERGDTGARKRIEAALTRGDVTTSPGVVPIAYVQQLVDGLGADRPLFSAMATAEMPAAGMTIRRPQITARPDGGFLANDQAGAPTSAVTIGNLDVPVKQWAWGGAASVALVERSAPSYIEEVFSQALKSFYRDVEADIASAFPDPTGGAASLGAAVAEFTAAYRTSPNLLVCGTLAYGALLDATGFLMFASGSADAQGNATYAGLRVVQSADLAPPNAAWVTARDFQEIRESTPIRLSVSNVESLSLEIGVTAFYARTQTLVAIPPATVNGAVGIPVFQPATAAAAESTRRGK